MLLAAPMAISGFEENRRHPAPYAVVVIARRNRTRAAWAEGSGLCPSRGPKAKPSHTDPGETIVPSCQRKARSTFFEAFLSGYERECKTRLGRPRLFRPQGQLRRRLVDATSCQRKYLACSSGGRRGLIASVPHDDRIRLEPIHSCAKTCATKSLCIARSPASKLKT